MTSFSQLTLGLVLEESIDLGGGSDKSAYFQPVKHGY
jgi:hypothetical protein